MAFLVRGISPLNVILQYSFCIAMIDKPIATDIELRHGLGVCILTVECKPKYSDGEVLGYHYNQITTKSGLAGKMAAFSWKIICNSYKDDDNVQKTAKTSSQDKTLFRIIWIKMNSKENQAKGRHGTLQHHSVTLEFSSAASNPSSPSSYSSSSSASSPMASTAYILFK